MEEKKIIINGHEAVDLGLSIKWATCNIGANKPYECGWDIWLSMTEIGKFYFGDFGLIDETTDVVGKLWGEEWRLPTSAEFWELQRLCSFEREVLDGMSGLKIMGPNTNSIFLPTTGRVFNGMQDDISTFGWYWHTDINDSSNNRPTIFEFDIRFPEYNSVPILKDFKVSGRRGWEGAFLRPVTDK